MGWEQRGHCTCRATAALRDLFGDPVVLWSGEEILSQTRTEEAGWRPQVMLDGNLFPWQGTGVWRGGGGLLS